MFKNIKNNILKRKEFFEKNKERLKEISGPLEDILGDKFGDNRTSINLDYDFKKDTLILSSPHKVITCELSNLRGEIIDLLRVRGVLLGHLTIKS